MSGFRRAASRRRPDGAAEPEPAGRTARPEPAFFAARREGKRVLVLYGLVYL